MDHRELGRKPILALRQVLCHREWPRTLMALLFKEHIHRFILALNQVLRHRECPRMFMALLFKNQVHQLIMGLR
jgi:hypothetical protein